MTVRPLMAGYLEKLAEEMSFEEGLLAYSLWEGYNNDERTRAFLELMEDLGMNVISLHVSGHAGVEAIERPIDTVKPSEIVPVRTENTEWFERFNK